MSELEEKLNSILSNPSEMEKVMNIARSLSGSLGTSVSSGGGGAASQPAQAADAAQGPAAQASAPLDLSSISSVLNGMDPKIFRLVTRLAGEYTSGKNDKAALLNAMKPYLKEDRRAKIDRAAEIAKLAKLARAAFSEFTGGEKGV
jgi:hypothetical protein